MKKTIFLFFICSISSFCQEIPDFTEIDSLYREDQFYVNISYNFLRNKPKDIFQNSFSTGINLGFLRDYPINKKRTFAIAPGIGLSYNNYKQNLLIDNTNNQIEYKPLTSNSPYDKNKFSLYFVDFPIEFRWRNSTPESHRFYRIYTGFKFSYLLFSQSVFIDNSRKVQIDSNPDFNKIQYGVYTAVGYNSWNLYVYYGLNSIFKNTVIANDPIKISTLNIGLMFYIL